MKKSILNIVAAAIIATTAFIACDNKNAQTDANATDSTAVKVDSAVQGQDSVKVEENTEVKADSSKTAEVKEEAAK